VATQEALAAVAILREHLPDLLATVGSHRPAKIAKE
jgi:hypothetical protein